MLFGPRIVTIKAPKGKSVNLTVSIAGRAWTHNLWLGDSLDKDATI